MTSKGLEGKCTLCNAVFARSAMTRHLKACLKKNVAAEKQWTEESSPETLFLLAVEGYGIWEEPYWMHLKVPGRASFKTLDSFFRKTWLECCGHMSAFRIGRMEVGKGRKLVDVLEPRMKLLYEYDFGDTTELLITVAGAFEGSVKKGEVEILARNDNPDITCTHCKETATLICVQCSYDDEGWLCDECADQHNCGPDYLLPVLNSPRTGICGYAG
ncbi:MAG: hypothetical protein ACE5GF_07115 [Thermodesulfobacteriota bacterium]